MYRELKSLFELNRLRDDLHEIYFNQIIETFAISLISVFIPIYLLTKGFSLLTSFSFMLVYWGAMFLFTPIAAEISSKIGFKHTIIYRAPLLIFYFSMLFFLDYFSSILLFIALLGGFSAILYWVSTNAEFVKSADGEKSAKQVSYLNALPQISAVAAPLISALILTTLGFSVIFLIVIILIIISQIPFLLTSDYKERFSLKLRQSWLFLDKRFFALFMIQGVIFSNDFLLWSIFVYQKFGIISAGLTASLYGAGMALFTVIIGKVSSEAHKRKNMLILGSIGYAFTCIIRISTATPLEAFLISMLAGIFTTLISIPIYVEFSSRAKKEGVLNWVTFRDFWLASGRVMFMLGSMFILIFFSENALVAGFALAAVASILLVLLAK
ncbi:MAG: MFS transporter [Candidatus Aenigmarchaeota archaeon]|nr:MFS transporter [Candidatus Aenigmarchaeota archaeon]